MFTPSEILFIILSILMLLFSMALSAAYFMQGLAGKLVSKLFRARIAETRILDRLFTLGWVVAGMGSIWMSGIKLSVSLIPVFLVFKSGADIGARIVFAWHDIGKINGKGAFRGAAAKILILSALPSVLFAIIWALFQKTVEYMGVLWLEKPVLPLGLWLSGVAYGLLYALLRSRGEERILLRGELILVMGSKIL